MGDRLILFLLVPPPPPPILFHAWPYGEPDTSAVFMVPGRSGLKSHIWHKNLWRVQSGALESTSLLEGREMLFLVSGKTALSGCLLPQRCSFSPNFPGTSRLCLGPARGLQALSISHTHKSVTRAKGEGARSASQLCYLLPVDNNALHFLGLL